MTQFYVKDSVTGANIQGARCTTYAGFDNTGEGVGADTDSSGYAYISESYVPKSWGVVKSGYTGQKGDWPDPVMNVSLVSTLLVYPVNLRVSGSGSITATLDGATVNPALIFYAKEDAILVVTASPATGNYLSKWRAYDTDYEPTNPISIKVTAALTLTAVFETRYMVTVTAGAGGTVDKSGTWAVDPGQELTIIATANTGYLFDHWVLDGTPLASNPQTISTLILTVTQPSTLVEAVFVKQGVPPPDKYNLIVSNSGNGTTDPTGTVQVDKNASKKITATANTGYAFDYWTVNGVKSAEGNPITVTVDRDNFTVQAVFKSTGGGTTWPVERSLTIFNGVVLQANQWETGVSKVSSEIGIGDSDKYLGARLEWSITYLEGNAGDVTVGVDVNNVNQVSKHLKLTDIYGPPVPSTTGSQEVTTPLYLTGNKVKIGHAQPLMAWSKVVYTVKLVLGYSAAPSKDPSVEKEGGGLPKLEWWQWGLVGLGGLAVLYVVSSAGGRGGGGGAPVFIMGGGYPPPYQYPPR